MEIVRATLAHLHILKQLGIKTFKDTFENTCRKEDMTATLELYFNEKQLESELKDKNDYFYICFLNGIAAGYMRIYKEHEAPFETIKSLKHIELRRLYVLHEYHGSGVAQSLMDYALQFARNEGYEAIYLGVWEYNFRARGFYERNGFINTNIKSDFPLGNTPQTDLWHWRKI